MGKGLDRSLDYLCFQFSFCTKVRWLEPEAYFYRKSFLHWIINKLWKIYSYYQKFKENLFCFGDKTLDDSMRVGGRKTDQGEGQLGWSFLLPDLDSNKLCL